MRSVLLDAKESKVPAVKSVPVRIALQHRGDGYGHPSEVLWDVDLTLNEKRAAGI